MAGGRVHLDVAGGAPITALPAGRGDDLMRQVVFVAQEPRAAVGDLEPLAVHFRGGGRERERQYAGTDAEERAFLGLARLEYRIGGRIRAQHHQPVVDLHERLLGVHVDAQLAAQPSASGRVLVDRIATDGGPQRSGVFDRGRGRRGIEACAVGQRHLQGAGQRTAGDPPAGGGAGVPAKLLDDDPVRGVRLHRHPQRPVRRDDGAVGAAVHAEPAFRARGFGCVQQHAAVGAPAGPERGRHGGVDEHPASRTIGPTAMDTGLGGGRAGLGGGRVGAAVAPRESGAAHLGQRASADRHAEGERQAGQG